MNYETRVTCMTVLPDGEPIFSEAATRIEIVDEAAGEYVVVSQCGDNEGKVQIEPDNWPEIRIAIDAMIKECRL